MTINYFFRLYIDAEVKIPMFFGFAKSGTTSADCLSRDFSKTNINFKKAIKNCLDAKSLGFVSTLCRQDFTLFSPEVELNT